MQLRHPPSGRDADPSVPLVQSQEYTGEGWVEELLADAAGRVLAERFAPATGGHCDRCSFHRSCSARPEGRQIVD